MPERDALSDRWTPEDVHLANEAAHSAYHDHNQKCACRTVGHLTHWIAGAVLLALQSDEQEATGA